MEDIIIVIPTHSKYLEIVNYFLTILKINWNNCPYKIIISVAGEDRKIDGYTNLYNGKNASLIDCITKAANKYKSRYYMCFLGDAFVGKKVNHEKINDLLSNIINSNIEYCSINYVKNYKKKKKYNTYFRYINELDRYSHSFVSFIANYDYINKKLINFKSDLQFEEYYLDKKENHYYSNHIIVNKNYFNILPSITKGKWDWINYHKLKRINPELRQTKFQISTVKYSIYFHIREKINSYISGNNRQFLKRIFKI